MKRACVTEREGERANGEASENELRVKRVWLTEREGGRANGEASKNE